MKMKEEKPSPLLQKIFNLRRTKGITLEQLGKAMGGLTQESVSRIENGDTVLKAEDLPAIAKLLGVRVWELFADYDPKEIGPLSEEEKALMIYFRQTPSNKEKKVIQLIAQELAKK